MVARILRGIGYFLPRLAGYGMILGTLFGALTYPVLGAIVGLPWGLAAGLVLGLILGVGVPVYEQFIPKDDQHQRRLTLGVGFITLVLTALPLLIVYSPVAALTAAYVTHHYSETSTPDRDKRKRKNDQLNDSFQRREGVVGQVASSILKPARWVAALGIGAAIVAYNLSQMNNGFPYNPLLESTMLAIAGVIYSGLIATVIAGINGLFVSFLNRLYFDPAMEREAYKSQVMILVGSLTLFLAAIVTFGVGAPFAAVAAAIGAGRYADWYYADESAYAFAESRLARGEYLEEDDDDLWHNDSVWEMAQNADERR